MSTAPPSYEAAAQQLKDLQAQGVSPENKAKAEAKVAEAMAEPQTMKELEDEIRQLSAATTQIDKDFYTVYTALGQVDNSGYVGTDGKPLPKLQPTWKTFKDRWVQLLWDSRRTATICEVHLADFEEAIIPMVEDALASGDIFQIEDARAELNNFVKGRNPFKDTIDAKDPQSHSQAFTDLARDLVDFKTKFDNFTHAQQKAVEAKIESLKGQIHSLTVEIQRCDQMVHGLSVAIGITLFATGVGALASLVALGPLGPCVALKVLIVGAIAVIGEKIALIHYANKSNQLQQQLRAKEAELKGLQDKLETLKKIQAILEAQKSTIGDIASRIARFGVIWAAVNHDATELALRLEKLDESGNRLMKYRLDAIKKTYPPVLKGLRYYATAVDNSGFTKLK